MSKNDDKTRDLKAAIQRAKAERREAREAAATAKRDGGNLLQRFLRAFTERAEVENELLRKQAELAEAKTKVAELEAEQIRLTQERRDLDGNLTSVASDAEREAIAAHRAEIEERLAAIEGARRKLLN